MDRAVRLFFIMALEALTLIMCKELLLSCFT